MSQSAMAGSVQNLAVRPSNSTLRPHHSENQQAAAANGTDNGHPPSGGGGGDGASSGVKKNGATANGTDNGTHHLLHDVGLSLVWSPAEQSSLEEGLLKYADQKNNLVKYIKLAALLPEKTVRDVALRCVWITNKENGKRRKVEEQNASKKTKDKKDKVEAPTRPVAAVAGRVPMPMYTPPPPPIDNDDGISYDAIGGPTGHLLEHNVQVIGQIRANLAACKLQENTKLLVQFRDNIFAILNGMTNMPGIMSQMPPLPVNLNSELADRILPMPQSSTPLHQ
ncbi:unnamed protein product [Sphagnum troendelagicum]|uniref:Uncharacterized protein n=1 Tax=Sphagnum troendelagicum TaxID=128251 RepID=A0ABP0UZV7_9BRYO